MKEAGFYFSKEDTPFITIPFAKFTEFKSGVLKLEYNRIGILEIYTEKIRNNWYYYEYQLAP